MVDDVRKRREPLPQLHGIYFITPSDESVQALIRDFSLAAMPQYKSAFVFFSSPPSPQQLQAIKSSPHLMSRIKTLQEVRVQAGGPGRLPPRCPAACWADAGSGGAFLPSSTHTHTHTCR